MPSFATLGGPACVHPASCANCAAGKETPQTENHLTAPGPSRRGSRFGTPGQDLVFDQVLADAQQTQVGGGDFMGMPDNALTIPLGDGALAGPVPSPQSAALVLDVLKGEMPEEAKAVGKKDLETSKDPALPAGPGPLVLPASTSPLGQQDALPPGPSGNGPQGIPRTEGILASFRNPSALAQGTGQADRPSELHRLPDEGSPPAPLEMKGQLPAVNRTARVAPQNPEKKAAPVQDVDHSPTGQPNSGEEPAADAFLSENRFEVLLPQLLGNGSAAKAAKETGAISGTNLQLTPRREQGDVQAKGQPPDAGYGGPAASALHAPSNGQGQPNSVRPVAEQIVTSIVTEARLITTGGRTDFHLRLEPPELGTVRVHLIADGQSVAAKLVVHGEAARQVIESQLQTLRQSLARAGVSLGSLDVQRDGNGTRQFGQSQQQPQPADAPVNGGPAKQVPSWPKVLPPATGTIDVMV